jgi:hypothetical protein
LIAFKSLVAVVCAAVFAVVLAGPAGARSAKAAQADAEARIDAFMPSSPGAPNVCAVRTDSGFFNHRHSYLASCSTSGGNFQFFFLTNARNGPFDVKSSYLATQIHTFCGSGGYVYATGVKGQFLAVFAEAAVAGSTNPGGLARGMRDTLAGGLRGYKGHQSADVCKPG